MSDDSGQPTSTSHRLNAVALAVAALLAQTSLVSSAYAAAGRPANTAIPADIAMQAKPISSIDRPRPLVLRPSRASGVRQLGHRSHSSHSSHSSGSSGAGHQSHASHASHYSAGSTTGSPSRSASAAPSAGADDGTRQRDEAERQRQIRERQQADAATKAKKEREASERERHRREQEAQNAVAYPYAVTLVDGRTIDCDLQDAGSSYTLVKKAGSMTVAKGDVTEIRKNGIVVTGVTSTQPTSQPTTKPEDASATEQVEQQ